MFIRTLADYALAVTSLEQELDIISDKVDELFFWAVIALKCKQMPRARLQKLRTDQAQRWSTLQHRLILFRYLA